MRLPTLTAVLVSVSLVLPVLASGQEGGFTEQVTSTDAADVDQFRSALLTYAYELPGEAGSELVERILDLSPEALAAWLNHVPDPERYVTLLLSLAAPTKEPARVALDSDKEPTLRSGNLDGAFIPDYPPNSGFYGGWLIDQLEIQGLLGGSFPNHDRCTLTGLNGWADRFEFWDLSKTISDGIGAACTGAQCDPLGIACAIACVPYAVACAVTAFAEVPLRECDAHIGNVDSAEIEAAYENSLVLLGNVEHVHDDLEDLDGDLADHDSFLDFVGSVLVDHVNAFIAHNDALIMHDTHLTTHDTNIDGDLATHDTHLTTHDTNIDNDLAAHDMAIQDLLDDIQGGLDNSVELRRVHMQVVEIKNRAEYLVVTTEAGLPVDVEFEALDVFDTDAGAFLALPDAAVSSAETGAYVVVLNLVPSDPNKIFRFRVRHAEAEVDHFGQVVFHRGTVSTAGL